MYFIKNDGRSKVTRVQSGSSLINIGAYTLRISVDHFDSTLWIRLSEIQVEAGDKLIFSFPASISQLRESGVHQIAWIIKSEAKVIISTRDYTRMLFWAPSEPEAVAFALLQRMPL